MTKTISRISLRSDRVLCISENGVGVWRIRVLERKNHRKLRHHYRTNRNHEIKRNTKRTTGQIATIKVVSTTTVGGPNT